MICTICESNITLPEGEHGVLVGRCPICGAGYGGASPDEIKMAAYEEAHRIIPKPTGPKGPFYIYFAIPHAPITSTGYYFRPMGVEFDTIREAEAWIWEHEQEWVWARIVNERDDYGSQFRREIHHKDVVGREFTSAMDHWRESVREVWRVKA
jgi:hypothetical protein